MTDAALGHAGSWRFGIYRRATGLLGPVAAIALRMRVRRGKEDPRRLGERLGVPGLVRPNGPLVWIHGASAGESLSALPIIDRIEEMYPGTGVLVTTGTVTSARLLERRLTGRAFHQFAPVDLPAAVARFLDNWKPDAALIMESELWPNLVLATRRRGIPMALLNARISEQSFNRWLLARGLAREILSSFDLCLAQDTAIAGRLESLGARNVSIVGNLKFAAAPLPADEHELERVRGVFAGRRVWLAASTHDGEERIAGHVHAILKERHASALTVIVPRHPDRGPAIAEALQDMGHGVALRSRGEPVTVRTDIYIADTMSELGIFYRLADIVFVGATLVPIGGHNPLEPARLNCAILHGPYTEKCFNIYRELSAAGAVIQVLNGDQLAREISALIETPARITQMSEAAFRICERADGVIHRAMVELDPLLRRALAHSPPPQALAHA